jgi:hypothetical protein
MTPLDITLTPAQWEHLDRHDWTLTVAPTEPCLECSGSGIHGGPGGWYDAPGKGKPCARCDGEGVVPRTVGIIRPEWRVKRVRARRAVEQVIPAERVGTATVTPVPVVYAYDEDTIDDDSMKHVGHIESADDIVLFWPDGWSGDRHDVMALFATPPAPGTTVWRLDKENTDA